MSNLTAASPHFLPLALPSLLCNNLPQVRSQFIFCLAATFMDGLGTIIHLGRGGHEVNPIWANLIDQMGVLSAMGFRIVVGILLLSILFHLWRRPLARVGLAIMAAAFVPLTLYHLVLLIYIPLVS